MSADEKTKLEELQVKLEASSRINAELIEREKQALTKLKAFEQAEAEAKAAAEKAEAEAALEAKIQAEVEKRLSERDTLGSIPTITEEIQTPEPEKAPEKEEPEIDQEKRNRLLNVLY